MTKASNIIYYSKISGDLTELIDFRDLMTQRALTDNKISDRIVKEDDATFLQKEITKEILNGRDKLNICRSHEIINATTKQHNYFTTAKITSSKLALNITLPHSIVANYFLKAYRTTRLTIPNMHISPETIFEVKKITQTYAFEKFSLGFTSIENGRLVGFSLSVVPATTGMKGQAQCLITTLTHDSYIVDDGAKYFDVSSLIANMSV